MKHRIDWATAIIALIGLAGTAVLWWALIERPQRAAVATVTAQAGQIVAKKRGDTAKDAARIIEQHFTHTREIERIRDAATAEIRTTPDAAAAHAAAVRAVCLLAPPPGGADNPACPLPGPGARQPEG
ncbi:MAG: hypothetical protein KGQ52_13435 [Alphaproteobacteria bacterium]|nr:hypothetical protein [Alphaproteobacteria bacterium]